VNWPEPYVSRESRSSPLFDPKQLVTNDTGSPALQRQGLSVEQIRRVLAEQAQEVASEIGGRLVSRLAKQTEPN
jgi:hypothetical protein